MKDSVASFMSNNEDFSKMINSIGQFMVDEAYSPDSKDYILNRIKKASQMDIEAAELNFNVQDLVINFKRRQVTIYSSIYPEKTSGTYPLDLFLLALSQ